MKIKVLNWAFLIFILFSMKTFATGNEGVGKSEVKIENGKNQMKTEPRYVEVDELEERDGRIYVKNEEKPFSGIAIRRYDTGEVEIEFNLENGLREGVSNTFYKSGKLESELIYANDKLEGNIKEYFENGNIKAVIEHKDNLYNGEGIFYYETGEIGARVKYKDGVLDGEVIEYDESGKIKDRIMYKNGERVETFMDKLSENWVFILGGILLLGLPFSLIQIFKTFPNMESKSDYEKKMLLDLFVEYDENKKSLHSANRINGIGTTYYTISKFKMNGEEFKILAKMYTILFIPLPYIIGYLACFEKNRILSSVSRKNFKMIKEGFNARILQ